MPLPYNNFISDEQEFITRGHIEEETSLGNAYFTSGSVNYTFTAAVAQYERALEEGGFVLEQMLAGTVRLLDYEGNTFLPVIPQPQQIISYLGKQYRIKSVHQDPTHSYIRIVAYQTTKGI